MCRNLTVKITCVLLTLVLFGGCVSSTMMTVYATDPNGRPLDNAAVSVNGESIGQTPNARKKVSNFAGTDVLLTVSRDGYYTTNTDAVIEAKAANILMGIFFINPFAYLWVAGPKANQNVVLMPVTAGE